MSSLKPYLMRTVYEWAVDGNLTPYLLVNSEAKNLVAPLQYAQDGRLVLNLRPQAVQGLVLGDSQIDFNARFGGVPMQVMIPIPAVLAIYAKENGQGMVFDSNEEDEPPPPPAGDVGEIKPSRPRPLLKIVK
ncbi:MAG: ClpXP protease specificity-enhancing factor [Methylococcaceae bacterium]|nr:ClpXP protease specificity-enhancing factor [Methylococcaceae bacterium]